MSTRFRRCSLVLIGALPCLLGGCTASAPRYALRKVWLHKDVLAVTVYLERPLGAEEYLAVVERELRRIAARPERPGTIPLYEVRFEFVLLPAGPAPAPVATAVARPGGAELPDLVLY